MNLRVLKMDFCKIYTLYIEKVAKKGRTKDELDTVIYWLTGHSKESLGQMLHKPASVGEFFAAFPNLNKNARLITGLVCGHKVQEIQDPLERNMRYLDKLVDELAKGKPIDKILRSTDGDSHCSP